nr:hypothetical protein CFP56_70187 [Quercus suber]
MRVGSESKVLKMTQTLKTEEVSWILATIRVLLNDDSEREVRYKASLIEVEVNIDDGDLRRMLTGAHPSSNYSAQVRNFYERFIATCFPC